MAKKVNKSQLPETDSIEELAHFWDKHDLTQFEDELVEVTEPIFERDTAVTIQLLPDEAEAIKQMALSQGIPDTVLIHRWVREKLELA